MLSAYGFASLYFLHQFSYCILRGSVGFKASSLLEQPLFLLHPLSLSLTLRHLANFEASVTIPWFPSLICHIAYPSARFSTPFLHGRPLLTMSERFVIGRTDPRTSTILLTKAKPSSARDEEGPLDLGSWLTPYQGDDPPRTAILCFEPKPKVAKDIKKFDVILDNGSPCRVLDAPYSAGADGEILIKVYDIFANEATDFITDDIKGITMVATRLTRYYVVYFSLPACIPIKAPGLMLTS